MVAVPADTPVTTPAELTVATDVLDDDQEPPDVVSDNEMVLPWQRDGEPVIGPALIESYTFLIRLLLLSAI